MEINSLLPQSEDAKFLDVPYKERWECLKHIIISLYIEAHDPNDKSLTIAQVAEFMRDKYQFFGAVNQYRAWFRKWDVRKRTLTGEKEEITKALGKRSRPQASTSNVKFTNGKSVDKKQLKRYLDDQIRHHHAEPVAPGVLSSWNLPYAAYVKAFGKDLDQASPFGTASATPPYLQISSPGAATPRPQLFGPSPTTQLVHQKLARDRSNLLLQGRHKDLLASCGKEDRITLTEYFHDFYMHSFITAKYWGKGPQKWTPGMISAFTLGSFDAASSVSAITAAPSPPESCHGRLNAIQAPTDLCQWAIHVAETAYQPVAEPARNVKPDRFDVNDPSSWQDWQSNRTDMSFIRTMKESITQSAFSRTHPESLPLSVQLVSQSVEKDPGLLMLDSWKMAIMSGNIELLGNLLASLEFDDNSFEAMNDIYPFHLAATFLDGANTCCGLLVKLLRNFPPMYTRTHLHDDSDHTLLDKFMVNILRSHTTVHPEQVSNTFNPPHRFPGEEKDSCGRWDVDSPALRALFRSGYARIPTDWKHAFCHTAVQASCHSIIAIFGSPLSPNIDTLSGLFVRRCNCCGLELKLGPLQTLVVVTFYLAHKGMPGETLFGTLAILVCLISIGADPLLKTVMSVEDILGTAEPGRCHHRPMDAYDLMEAVPLSLKSHWDQKCQTGWLCIMQILRIYRDDEESSEHQPQAASLEAFHQEFGHTFYQNTETDLEFDQRFHQDFGNPFLQDSDHPFPQGFDHPFLQDFDQEADPALSQDLNQKVDESSDQESTFESHGSSDQESTFDSDAPHCQLSIYFGVGVHDEWLMWPRPRPKLALLWATIQVELLTYRRVRVGDSWISDEFSMDALKSWLQGESETFKTPLVDKKRMKKYSPCCGWFVCEGFVLPTAAQVCKTHFMNMDIYARTTFHPQEILDEEWIEMDWE